MLRKLVKLTSTMSSKRVKEGKRLIIKVVFTGIYGDDIKIVFKRNHHLAR